MSPGWAICGLKEQRALGEGGPHPAPTAGPPEADPLLALPSQASFPILALSLHASLPLFLSHGFDLEGTHSGKLAKPARPSG